MSPAPYGTPSFGGGGMVGKLSDIEVPGAVKNPLALFGNYNGPGGYQAPGSAGQPIYTTGNSDYKPNKQPPATPASSGGAAPGGAVFGGTSGAPNPPAGLIGGAMNGGAQSWQVDAPQTVESRAAGIINNDGPLMQQARGYALQKANERGLINSSLGIQAAQDAVTGRAVDIARQDAATAADAAKFNVNQGNSWNLAQQELNQRGGQFDKELAQKGGQFEKDIQYRYDAARLNNENAVAMTGLENKYRTQLQNDSAFNKQYEMYVDALYRIDSNKDLDAPAKIAMKQEQARILDDYAKVRGLGLNLDFSTRFPVAETEQKVENTTTAPAEAQQNNQPRGPGAPGFFQWNRND